MEDVILPEEEVYTEEDYQMMQELLEDNSTMKNCAGCTIEDKFKVADFVNIGGEYLDPNSDKWGIIDKVVIDAENDDILYMLHYNDRFYENIEERYLLLRGTVVSNKYGVICPSLPADQKIRARPDPNTRDYFFEALDERGQRFLGVNVADLEHPQIVISRAQIFPYFEGVTLRIFRYANKTFVSTYRKIDLLNQQGSNLSRFGDVIFKDLFVDVITNAHLDLDNFYPRKHPYSSITHTLILQSPELASLNRMPVTNLLIYIQAIANGLNENFEEHRSLAGKIDHIDHFSYSNQNIRSLFHAQIAGQLYRSGQMSLKEWNEYMRNGSLPRAQSPIPRGTRPNDRLTNGESVIIYEYDDNGSIISMFHVLSQAARWRSTFHQHNQTLKSKFYNDLYAYSYSDAMNSPQTRYNAQREFLRRFLIPVDSKYITDRRKTNLTSAWPEMYRDTNLFNQFAQKIIKHGGWYGPVISQNENGHILKNVNFSKDMIINIILVNFLLATSPMRAQDLLNYRNTYSGVYNSLSPLIIRLKNANPEELNRDQRKLREKISEVEENIYRDSAAGRLLNTRIEDVKKGLVARLKLGNLERILTSINN